MFKQGTTICPKCKTENDLIVKKVTITTTGKILNINSKLNSDGFEFEYNEKDASTENEKIICTNCCEHFSLNDLEIKGDKN